MKIAAHEAGHAVACYRLLGPIGGCNGKLSIISDEIGHGGSAQCEGSWNYYEIEAKLEVLHLCSGYAACVAAGMDDTVAKSGCDKDFAHAEKFIVHFGLSPLEDHLKQAVEIMREPKNLRAVKRLVDELLEWKTLDGELVAAIIVAADKGTPEAEADLVRYRATFNK